jgi:RNA polymerase sigma-70 factor, ECF subfamily
MATASDDAVLAAARAGDETAFAALVDRYGRELRVHCYRMLGSFEDSEDLVQETFLRAWKGLPRFEGRATVRAWLYRIATNACLDALAGTARRVLPDQLAPPSAGGAVPTVSDDVAWLQPFPDRLWEPVAPRSEQPDARAVARETIELAFLAAIQHLPPRQRAALILRDVVGWPARQVADLLDSTVASVNSAVQRARATLKEHLPARRADWAPSAAPSDQERTVLRRYMDAVEAADLAAVAALLAEDVRTTMPPFPMWFAGRDAVLAALAASWNPGLPGYVGRLRLVPTRANGRPAFAAYARRGDEPAFRPFAISVVRIEDGRIVELTAFHEPDLFAAFDLPPSLPPGLPAGDR